MNLFCGLIKGGVNKEILFIIDKFSRLFQSADQYFKLRELYEGVILPKIVRRAKHSVRVEEQVYELGRFYIMGFRQHCNIGEEGVKCILANL